MDCLEEISETRHIADLVPLVPSALRGPRPLLNSNVAMTVIALALLSSLFGFNIPFLGSIFGGF